MKLLCEFFTPLAVLTGAIGLLPTNCAECSKLQGVRRLASSFARFPQSFPQSLWIRREPFPINWPCHFCLIGKDCVPRSIVVISVPGDNRRDDFIRDKNHAVVRRTQF